MPSSLIAPFQFFVDASGAPLTSGFIYMGVSGQNPEVSPIAVYWDEALTIPAAQPIRTAGGYPVRGGTPGNIYTAGDSYSVLVRDHNKRLLYSNLNATTAGVPPSYPLAVALGGTGGATAAAARTALSAAKSGDNTDITSLSDPAIGDATATTQAAEDSTTKVATTACVDAKIASQISSVISAPVRQTVLGGPVDASGFPSFLPSTDVDLNLASQNISASAPFIVASANGFGANGAVDRIGHSTVNLTWTGLTDNTKNYLYVDVAADGVLTTGHTTLAPAYKWGGSRSVTSGQATFNIQEMSLTVGNGAVANQTYRVFVGEATTVAGAVASTVCYAYQGRYDSGAFTFAASTLYSKAHNIGVCPVSHDLVLVNQTAELNYAIGDEVRAADWYYNNTDVGFSCTYDTVTASVYSHGNHQIGNKTTGGVNNITLGNWKVKIMANRGW